MNMVSLISEFGTITKKITTHEKLTKEEEMVLLIPIAIAIIFIAAFSVYTDPTIRGWFATKSPTGTQQQTEQTERFGNLFGTSADTVAIATETGTMANIPITAKNGNGQETSINAVEIKDLQFIAGELTGKIKSRTSEMKGVEIGVYSADGKSIGGRYTSAPQKESVDYRPFKIPIRGDLTKARIELSIS